MRKTKVNEGDLVAHLDGQKRKRVEKALHESPELQQKFDELSKFAALLQHNFGGVERPDPQDLVDVASGQATDQQRLLIDAYARDSVRGQRELELLRKEAETPNVSATAFIAQLMTIFDSAHSLVSQPLGVRSAIDRGAKAESKIEQVYQVIELQLEIRLQIIRPVHGELWQIIGNITQNTDTKAAIPGVQIALYAKRGRPRWCKTDAAGFFAFRGLKQNIYRMKGQLVQEGFIIPNLELNESES